MSRQNGLRKNDVIEPEITGYTSEGSGVGHVNGQAVFVAGAAAGDTVECVVIKAKENYAVGKLLNVIKASPDRIQPDCPAFPRCGGCVFRHISYEAELRLKQRRVEDAFRRIGKIGTPVSPIRGADSPDRYRNKAQYPVAMENGRLQTGFYAPFSHRVIDCKNCRLQPEAFAPLLKATAKWAEKYKIPVYNEETGKGLLRHIYLRRGAATGEIMVCPVVNGERLYKADELVAALVAADKNVKTVLLNVNTEQTNVILGKKNTVLYGPGYIEDVLCGRRFRISPLSFYQVNHDQAEALYRQAAAFALKDETGLLLDLYCGTGTIGLTMADRVRKLIGAEIVPEAVADAKVNAALNGEGNAEFLCADAAEAAKTLKERGLSPDVVLLDPPRKGCTPDVLETVAAMKPGRIVYISCDPATLARDCALLKDLGYQTEEIVPFDLFPRTAHVETVVLLSRERIKVFPADRQQMEDAIASTKDPELKKAYTEMLGGCLAHPEQWDWYAMWIIENEDGSRIGDLCFKGYEDGKNPEIGYGINEEFQGKGYATEAVKLAIAWAFRHPGVAAVEAETDPDNIASQKVLAKCGFKAAGTIGEEGPRFIVYKGKEQKY